MMRVFRVVAVSTLLLFPASALCAEARDPAAAELLFSAGREAFENGDYAAACAKFEESQRLDPAPGTLMNLGACNEKLGRLAVAWEHWREALRLLGKDDERYSRLEARLRALELRVPKLELNLAATAPSDTRVTRDGVPLRGPALGVAIPVDPGEHVIEAVAKGREARRYVIHLEEGKTMALFVEPGSSLPNPAQTSESAPSRDRTAHEASNSRRTLGFVIGGVGLAGIAVSGVTGLMALQKKSVVTDECDKRGDDYICNTSSGVDAANAGATFATVSTVSAIVGGGALLVGGYFVLTSGTSGDSQTALRTRVSAEALRLDVVRTF